MTFIAAIVVVLLVGLLLSFIAWNGIQLFIRASVPLLSILSPDWAPSTDQFGILPFILGTIGVMVVAAIIATPLSVGLALFIAEVAPTWARNIIRPAMEIFVGIPSVVYGWLGLTILVPFLRENFAWLNRFTLSLLKQHPGRESIAMKRRSCGWSEDFLLKVLAGTTL